MLVYSNQTSVLQAVTGSLKMWSSDSILVSWSWTLLWWSCDYCWSRVSRPRHKTASDVHSQSSVRFTFDSHVVLGSEQVLSSLINDYWVHIHHRSITYSRYLSASIHLSTLLHCITPKPPLATHWMASTFQTATVAYKALHTGQPLYLSELLQHYEPTRTLRSSSSFQLCVPRYNLEFGSRAFRISAPKMWNLLPASIQNSLSLLTFHRHLKTHHFQSVYPYA